MRQLLAERRPKPNWLALPCSVPQFPRLMEEAAKALGVNLEVVERYILKGALKLCDARITERSLQRFCRRNGSLINSEFLNQGQ